jgi:hypothetical protein
MAHWKPVDQVQDLVNKMGGEEGISRFLSGELKLVPRDSSVPLRPVGEPIVLPAVPKFVAKVAFTKANGIAWMGDNFREFILPVVEENVPEVAIRVSELTRAAKDFRIAAELKVDETGEVALAHFFQAIQRKLHTWLAAYVIGSDGETWAVFAYLFSGGWSVDAYRLGVRHGWSAGLRFLSR